jgi:hypothetical protein
MSQESIVVPDGSGADVLADINAANETLVTQNSGATAPSETYPHMMWADTLNDVIWRRNEADTAWVLHASLSDTPVASLSSNTTLGLAHHGRTIFATGTITLSLDAAATLTAGWKCQLFNVGSGVVTLDPNSSELVDGATTFALMPGSAISLVCSGAGFHANGSKGWTLVATPNTATVDIAAYPDGNYQAIMDHASHVPFQITNAIDHALWVAGTLTSDNTDFISMFGSVSSYVRVQTDRSVVPFTSLLSSTGFGSSFTQIYRWVG